MKEKKYNFCYVTTNLINRKQYVGDHSTNNLNCGNTKNYIGSGHPYLANAINKYGKENFKREILEFFDTKQEAFDAQFFYITKFNTLIPNGYNISPFGGIGKNCYLSEETKNKISKSMIGINAGKIHNIEQNIQHSNIMKGKTHTEETKRKISDALKGRKLSEEHKQNLIGKNLGKKHSEEQNKNHNEKISGENHPYFGKSRSDETKEKIRNSNLGKKRSVESRKKMSESAKNRNKT